MKKLLSSLRRALVAPVLLGGILALPAFAVMAPAQASVFFDFVCAAPTPDCNGDSQFSGTFEFSEFAANSAWFYGRPEWWLSFTFTIGSTGVTVTRENLNLIEPTDVYFLMSDDRNSIRAIGAFIPGIDPFPVTFGARGGYVDIVTDCKIGDEECPATWHNTNVGTVFGEWVRRTPEALSMPGTLALFGLGLAGLVVLRRRRA